MATEGYLESEDPERVAYAKRLRLLVSPKGSINEEGSIIQDFFKPQKVMFVQEKTWGIEEKEKLYQGIEEYGVGEWNKVKEALLPKWEAQQLRIKASRLFGSQSLARYNGSKFTQSQVEAEYAQNKAIGEQTGCWKAGVLVEDDNGSVMLALKELQS
mmetsp:Transcript_25891/g.49223  ORF Transcript_25891/g.49223 Transcript_25891/m.49223 type:complete len:157 (+) Transcript_25891:117-587(+)|eukprot:CAMPEP_0114251656 /NCGR_PEP_ID=MMETSP0058-20121206/15392_1 /TAXON_ID=36894 /ORGANISM="Pyramimonas parkeae, CCMP726" /LENGTH=156 /DNA_ID=CAMNT_0001365483 /DNA_START=94 /DNA_END=564 /DNA_ORIENTATION=+